MQSEFSMSQIDKEQFLNQSSVQRAQYPDLNTVVPAAQYIEMNDVQIAAAEKQQETSILNREEFLIQYYRKILIQHSIILVIFLFGLMDWFSSIVVITDYYWHWHQTFRWTWWVFLGISIAIALGLPVVRNIRTIVNYQNIIFNVQTILLGFIIVGISGIHRSSWYYGTVNTWIIIILLVLIGHSIAQIVMVKNNATRVFTVLMKFSIMGSLILNLIVALYSSELSAMFPIAETIIIYSIYYFNQLNEQLLKQPNELPFQYTIIERIQKLSQFKIEFQQQMRQNQVVEQLNETHFVVNKYLVTVILSAIIYIVVFILSIITGNALYIVLVVVGTISLLSVILETQVASRTLLQQDSTIAVCLTYLDLASPLKNLIRSLIKQ